MRKLKLSFWMLMILANVRVSAAPFDPFPVEPLTSPVSSSRPEFVEEPTPLEQRILQLEQEVAELRSRDVGSPMATLDQQLQRQDAGSGGLFGSVELTFLQPHFSGARGAFGLSPIPRTIDSDYHTGVRYILGYALDSGLGIRGRYWSYNYDFGYLPPFHYAELGIEAETSDLEVTLDQRLRHLDLGLSAGIRYGKLEYSNSEATLYGIGTLTFEGVGPTLAIDGRRELGNSGFVLFGNLRGSALIGDIQNAAPLTLMPRINIEDEVLTIAENQLGVAWTRNVLGNTLLEVRAAWETQYWVSHTIADDVYGMGSNLGFSGPTLAVELKY